MTLVEISLYRKSGFQEWAKENQVLHILASHSTSGIGLWKISMYDCNSLVCTNKPMANSSIRNNKLPIPIISAFAEIRTLSWFPEDYFNRRMGLIDTKLKRRPANKADGWSTHYYMKTSKRQMLRSKNSPHTRNCRGESRVESCGTSRMLVAIKESSLMSHGQRSLREYLVDALAEVPRALRIS